MCERYSYWCDKQHNGRDCCWYLERHKRKSLKLHRAARGLFAQVIARDGAECRWCGTTSALTKDHVVPVSAGGENKLSNLQVLCRECNSLKADHLPDSAECIRIMKRRQKLKRVTA